MIHALQRVHDGLRPYGIERGVCELSGSDVGGEWVPGLEGNNKPGASLVLRKKCADCLELPYSSKWAHLELRPHWSALCVLIGARPTPSVPAPWIFLQHCSRHDPLVQPTGVGS